MSLMLKLISSFFIKYVFYILTIIIFIKVALLTYIKIFLTSKHHNVYVETIHVIFIEI